MLSALTASLWQRRPDIILGTSPQFFCGWAALLASYWKRVPFVLEIRDIWPESIVAVGAMKNGRLLSILQFLERVMYRSATHIVTVGEGYRKNILSKVDVQKRSSVITNGVDIEHYIPFKTSGEFSERYGLQEKFVCSYVGTLGMAHGLDVVIRAAQILKKSGRQDIAFCLVGDGAQLESLQKEASEKGVDKLVVFTGRLPKEQIPMVLASSNVSLVHLKKCDLFSTVIPSKIFETMAMGKPIIMGVRGEAQDIVLGCEAGIPMEPDSAESLVAAVTRLADDTTLCHKLSQAGRQHVASEYNRDILAKRYLDLLRDVVDSKSTDVSHRSTEASATITENDMSNIPHSQHEC